MKQLSKLAFLLGALLTVNHAAAAPNTKTVALTVINNTNTTFTYTGVTGQNPGNTFSLDKQSIAPHQSAIITGTITQDDDLAGLMHFSDNNNHDTILVVIDPRNMHSMQPVFEMRNSLYYSTMQSETHGDPSKPRELAVTAVTIAVKNIA